MGQVGFGEFDRRRFLLAVGALSGAGVFGLPLTGCAPSPSIDAARDTLMSLWDAIIPGTWHDVIEDVLPNGLPAPGATDAGVMQWFESGLTTLPAPLDYVTDWFLRAWAADLDLWADTFHPPFEGAPTFGQLPLGPSAAVAGRQYKIMMMVFLFDGLLDLKYFGGVSLAKMAFYGDFWAETSGADRVGGPYIGFAGPNGPGPVESFTYNKVFGVADPRLAATPDGLRMAP